jgi:predicted HicB family RNase H-like nuclease
MAKKSKKAAEKAEKIPEEPQRAVKVPVALRFNADLLASIDKVALRRGMSRNALISYWCSRAVEAE